MDLFLRGSSARRCLDYSQQAPTQSSSFQLSFFLSCSVFNFLHLLLLWTPLLPARVFLETRTQRRYHGAKRVNRDFPAIMDVLALQPALSPALPVLLSSSELYNAISQRVLELLLAQQATIRAYLETLADSEHVAKLYALAQRHLTIPPVHVVTATAQSLAVKNARSYTIHYAVQFALHFVLRFAPASNSLPITLRLAIYLVRLAVRQVVTVAARMALGQLIRQIPVRVIMKRVRPAAQAVVAQLPRTLLAVR